MINRFRSQYQKGDICVTEHFESEAPISSSQILLSLAKLAMKVQKEVNTKTGLKVALEVLRIHEHVMKNIHEKDNVGGGPMKSFYLDKKSKNKMERSERIDIECYGSFGASDNLSMLNKYIMMYREYKKWNQ